MNLPEKHVLISDFFLRSWRPYVWIVLIASLPYLHILTFSEYTYHDDSFLILESFSYINKLSNIGHAFLEDASHQGQGGNLYRPLLTISLILNAQANGITPFGYHLIDIILHGTCCALLFITLQKIGFKRSLSFLGTLVFCIHPALTQTVAWIPGRNDSLLAFFILLCFLSFIQFLSTSYLRWYFLHLFFFACAMFTKETSIVFPVLAMLYFYNLKGKKILSITTILFFVGWGIVLFNWHILRSAAMIAPMGNKFHAAGLVLSTFPVALYYLGKIFWPLNLAFAPIFEDIHFTIGILSLIALILMILFSERRDWKKIIFGTIWFLAFLIPTFYHYLGADTLPKFYEHRIYLPFMGILFVLLSLSYSDRLGYFKRFLPPIAFLVFISLGWLSYTHSFNFKDSLALSEYDATTSPNEPRRYSDITKMAIPEKLGQVIKAIRSRSPLQENDRTSISKKELWEIIDTIKTELRSNRNDTELYHALAVAYFARGLFLSSEENFYSAIKRNPHNAAIFYNLGILYYSAQPKMKAENAWQEAVRLDPAAGDAHLNLSYLYYESGYYQTAWDHCQKAMQLGMAVPPGLVNEIQKHIAHY
jgi:hypothetical protein